MMATSAMYLLISALELLTLPLLGTGGPSKLPSNFLICRRSDPHVNECLKHAMQTSLSELARGIRKLGVLPIDPLFVTQMNIDQGQGPVNVRIEYKDQNITGFRNMQIKAVRANLDPNNYRLEIDVRIPYLQLYGDYIVSGKVFVLPATGAGKSNTTLDEITAFAVIIGKPKMKQGEEYVEIETFTIKFQAKRMFQTFENLFNGDKVLGENMNTFLNDNWEVVLSEMGPVFEDALGAIFKDISNRIYMRVPYKDIHPE